MRFPPSKMLSIFSRRAFSVIQQVPKHTICPGRKNFDSWSGPTKKSGALGRKLLVTPIFGWSHPPSQANITPPDEINEGDGDEGGKGELGKSFVGVRHCVCIVVSVGGEYSPSGSASRGRAQTVVEPPRCAVAPARKGGGGSGAPITPKNKNHGLFREILLTENC